MKSISVFVLGLGLFVNAFNVQAADLKPITQNTPASDAANVANSIFSVTNLRTKTKAYKVVVMNSVLNGDIGSTSLVLVGDEVGGEAGYDAAFQITPNDKLMTVKSARVVNNEVELSVLNIDGKVVKQTISFDEKRGVLKTR